MTASLLRTKTCIPHVRAKVVSRPRLVDMTPLALKVENRLTTVTGIWFDDTPVTLEDWAGTP
jgi:hypothetical protein